MVDGIPILFDESESLLRVSSFTGEQLRAPSKKGSRLSRLIHARPSISHNIAAKRNYRRLGELIEGQDKSKGLVVGCGEGGEGIGQLAAAQNLSLVYTDVRLTPCVHVLCDAHQLPFQDGVFDVAVVQAVLEHVLDPFRAVNEITRVLKPDGLVYSEFPFIQPVHGAPFDFMRLTHLGHRRLWRQFEEIGSGSCCGPGMALARMIQAFIRCLLPSKAWAFFSDRVTDWSLWWLKYMDPRLVGSTAGIDCASASWFLGRKSSSVLSDAELIMLYGRARRNERRT